MPEWIYDLEDILLSDKMYNNSYRICGEGICKFWIEVNYTFFHSLNINVSFAIIGKIKLIKI